LDALQPDLSSAAALPFGPFVAYGHELLLDLSQLGPHIYLHYV
jgi:hypothetical protein